MLLVESLSKRFPSMSLFWGAPRRLPDSMLLVNSLREVGTAVGIIVVV